MAGLVWGTGGEEEMEIMDVVAQARDAMTVNRVFGEPFEKNGVTVIPAASIRGGAGGGSGEGPEGTGKGGGTGFGLFARPAGAYVIRNGQVTWQPALDLTRVVIGAQVVAVVALLVIRTIAKARGRRRQ
jgi:uncharacterized spore protein YtfJ